MNGCHYDPANPDCVDTSVLVHVDGSGADVRIDTGAGAAGADGTTQRWSPDDGSRSLRPCRSRGTADVGGVFPLGSDDGSFPTGTVDRWRGSVLATPRTLKRPPGGRYLAAGLAPSSCPTIGGSPGGTLAPRGLGSLTYRRQHDPDDAVPRTDQRAQRDRAVGALVEPPGRRSLPDVGQVRVLRGPQCRGPVRLVTALQVPDPRARRRALPGRRPRSRRPDVRSGARAVHGLVRRSRLRRRGRRRPAARRRRVHPDRGRAEPRLFRWSRRPSRRRDRGRVGRPGRCSPSRAHGHATSSRR